MIEQHVRTSKYLVICEWLKSEIESRGLRPGDKIPSENELCEKFDVSRSAARQAVSTLVHEGRLETKKGLGTFVLPVKRNESNDLALLCYKLGAYIFPRMATRFGDVTQRNGFHMLLGETRNDPEKERDILRKLREKPVAGIAIEPSIACGKDGSAPDPEATNYRLLCDIQASGIPVVLIDNSFGDDRFPTITMNDDLVGRTAMRYLLERGHREIGIVFAGEHRPFQVRKNGALSELREAGISVRPEWLIEVDHIALSFESMERFVTGTGAKPTAFFCTNDEIAVSLYKAADAAGLAIPRDLSVISVDNSEFAELPGIALTSIDHPGRFIGEKAAQILVDELEVKDVRFRSTYVIDPVLVERDSVRDLRITG